MLFANQSMARWRGTAQEEPDWTLDGPLHGFRNAHSVPGCCVPQVLTSTDRSLQLWTSTLDGLRLEHQVETSGQQRSGDLTALACAPWIVACGHRTGEISLLSLPSFLPLD